LTTTNYHPLSSDNKNAQNVRVKLHFCSSYSGIPREIEQYGPLALGIPIEYYLELDEDDIRRNTQNSKYALFENNNISLPEICLIQDVINPDILSEYRVGRIFDYLRRISMDTIANLEQDFPNVEFILDLET